MRIHRDVWVSALPVLVAEPTGGHVLLARAEITDVPLVRLRSVPGILEVVAEEVRLRVLASLRIAIPAAFEATATYFMSPPILVTLTRAQPGENKL